MNTKFHWNQWKTNGFAHTIKPNPYNWRQRFICCCDSCTYHNNAMKIAIVLEIPLWFYANKFSTKLFKLQSIKSATSWLLKPFHEIMLIEDTHKFEYKNDTFSHVYLPLKYLMKKLFPHQSICFVRFCCDISSSVWLLHAKGRK